MPAAFAVVGCFRVTLAVVVVQHEVLAFVANDLGNASEFFSMLRDKKRTRIQCYDHPRRINVATFVVNRTHILCRANSDIRRIVSVDVLRAVCIGDVNRVIRII